MLYEVITCIGHVDAVLVDNTQAAQDATSYLIQQGHEQIGIIVGPRDVSTAMDRLSGYTITLKKNNIEVKESLIEYSEFTIESGYRACKKLLTNNPEMTALFATNYDTTMGAMMAIRNNFV